MDTIPNDGMMDSNWLTKSPVSKHRRQHSCTRCRHHGLVEVRVLNHQCPYKSCTCSSCVLVKQRALMYRSKNSKGQRDDGTEDSDLQYSQDGMDSPGSAVPTNYGSLPTTESMMNSSRDPLRTPASRNHQHQMLRASPATGGILDSPPGTGQRSNFCPSPWDSKSSSGSSYASSLTPGPIEWSGISLPHNQQPTYFPTAYDTQLPPPVIGAGTVTSGKVNDFRQLCVTFPDYSVSQLQAIFESSGNDFDRTVDTILMRRWTEDNMSSKLAAESYADPSSSFNTGSSASYLNNNTTYHHPSQQSLGQNGYSTSLPGYVSGPYGSNSNFMSSSNYHNHGSSGQPLSQPHTPQAQYPSSRETTSHTPYSHGHHSYNGSSIPYGSNGGSYYGHLQPTTQTTYSDRFSSSSMSQTQQLQNANQYNQQQKTSLNDSSGHNGSRYPSGSMNGSQHRSESGGSTSSYQDLSKESSANVSYGSGPRSFAATVVSQSAASQSSSANQQSTRHPSLTETMLNQVRSPGSPPSTPGSGDKYSEYQQLIADDPLPLNEAMAVPIKRKRGRPKKVPGSPPVKRTSKKDKAEKVRRDHSPKSKNHPNEHTVTTSAIFKVPQAMTSPTKQEPPSSPQQPLPPPLWSPLTSLPNNHHPSPNAQVNGDYVHGHDHTSPTYHHDSSSCSLNQDLSSSAQSWQTSSPQRTTDTSTDSSLSPNLTLSSTVASQQSENLKLPTQQLSFDSNGSTEQLEDAIYNQESNNGPSTTMVTITSSSCANTNRQLTLLTPPPLIPASFEITHTNKIPTADSPTTTTSTTTNHEDTLNNSKTETTSTNSSSNNHQSTNHQNQNADDDDDHTVDQKSKGSIRSNSLDQDSSKSRHLHRESNGNGRRPVTRSSAHRFASI